MTSPLILIHSSQVLRQWMRREATGVDALAVIITTLHVVAQTIWSLFSE